MFRFGALMLAVALGSRVAAQTPSVSGAWRLDPLAPECRGGVAGRVDGAACGDGGGAKILCGQNLSIEIDADTFKVERVVDDKTLTMAFPLNGSTVRHSIAPCRNLPTNPSNAFQRELELYKQSVVPGSDDMTTSVTRDGREILLRTSYAPSTEKGVRPRLVIEQTQRLSLSTLGHLVVETDRTATDTEDHPIKTKSRLVYARPKAFD